MSASIAYQTFVLVFGSSTDVLLGFIAARVAPAAARANALAAGLLLLAVSLPMIPWLSDHEPTFFLVASFLVVIPAALLGVRLSERVDGKA